MISCVGAADSSLAYDIILQPYRPWSDLFMQQVLQLILQIYLLPLWQQSRRLLYC